MNDETCKIAPARNIKMAGNRLEDGENAAHAYRRRIPKLPALGSWCVRSGDDEVRV